MTETSAIVGIDVGATTTSAGLVTPEGEILAFAEAPTRTTGGDTPVNIALALATELTSRARGMGMPLAGIGVGLPGLVDAEKGMMIYEVNHVPEFAHVPLADLLRGSTGLTTFVDNDVNVLALGEHRFGVGRGADSLVMLAIGTGVGGAVIIGDALVRGHASCAGEFGHLPIDPNGPVCRCGNRGCLNAFAAGMSMAGRGRERAVAAPHSLLMALAGGDPDRITAQLVFRAAAMGDPAAGSTLPNSRSTLSSRCGPMSRISSGTTRPPTSPSFRAGSRPRWSWPRSGRPSSTFRSATTGSSSSSSAGGSSGWAPACAWTMTARRRRHWAPACSTTWASPCTGGRRRTAAPSARPA